MIESFYATHDYLISHVDQSIHRALMDEINWSDRLIAITGGRGVGKTDLLLRYARRQRDRFPDKKWEILYVDLNNFYFAEHSLYQFAGRFVAAGGKTLLLDQLFMIPNWQKELSDCYYNLTDLQIIFVASPLMQLDESQSELGNIVKVYKLRGYSLREYINLQPEVKTHLPVFSLEDILSNHPQIAKQVMEYVRPLNYLHEYMRHGYYPYREVNRDFSQTLLRTMNMSIEVDILLNQQIEVAYLPRIRQLLYCLLNELPGSLNVSELATHIDTSRATVMNYIKFLKDARIINLLYKDDRSFPKKPTRVYLQNPNLCYALPSRQVSAQDLAETFFYTALHGSQKINADENATFLVNRKTRMDVFASMPKRDVFRYTAIADLEIGHDKCVPLWLFGFLY